MRQIGVVVGVLQGFEFAPSASWSGPVSIIGMRLLCKSIQKGAQGSLFFKSLPTGDTPVNLIRTQVRNALLAAEIRRELQDLRFMKKRQSILRRRSCGVLEEGLKAMGISTEALFIQCIVRLFL